MKSLTIRFVQLIALVAALSSPALGQWSGGRGWGNPSAPGSVPSNGFFITPRSFQSFNSQNFAGIGTGRASIDLLSNPARFQTFPTPINPNPCPPRVGFTTLPESILARPRDPQLFNGAPAFMSRERAFTEAGGFSADGRWHGKNWWLRFHLGSGFTTWPCRGARCNNVVFPGFGFFPSVGYPFPYYDNSYYPDYSTQMMPVYQQPPMQQPQQAQQQPKGPPSDLEIGLSDMSAGEWDSAITRLRKHLKVHMDDSHAMRYLAVALLQTKKFDDGSALMRQAYRGDPTLAGDPIPALDLGLSDTELRRLVNSTVLYAHRVNSASSWLTVAVLMQAEGRGKVAQPMLERAQKQGLEQIILDPMRGALTQ